MAVSLVRPVLGPVLQCGQQRYRIIAQRADYSLAYPLPSNVELRALVGISSELYQEACTRYERWCSGAAAMPCPELEYRPVALDVSSDAALWAALTQESPWRRLGPWRLVRLYRKRPADQPEALVLAECMEVADPAAPLLHTAYNRWERIKSRELSRIVAPLDLAALADGALAQGELPQVLLTHLLHVWCLFGGVKECLKYAQELLYAGPLLSWDEAAAQGAKLRAQLWASCYQLLARCPSEQWPERLAAWGAVIEAAWGRYCVLTALKHSALFAPRLAEVQAQHDQWIARLCGRWVSRGTLEAYGIDPRSSDLVLPLPRTTGPSAEEQAALDHHFMGLALEQAVLAFEAGEVPVGAVLVAGTRVLAATCNGVIAQHDPSAHAEVLALRAAGALVQNYRLTGTTLYVTLEPCCMCAMAAIHARVGRIVYGAADPRTGACGSSFNLVGDPRHNHQLQVEGGLRAAECAQLLQRFFAARRGR